MTGKECDMSDQVLLAPGKKAGSRFGNFLKNNNYVWLAILASAALMIFMWFCNQMIPFGNRTILRMDLYHQYGPLFAELYERLAGGRSLLYSWNTGLGGGFLGNFFNYLSSPTGLLVLFFGHENIPEAIAAMILVKCAAASGAFAYMLRKVFGRNDASIAAFGVLYSFCSFFIAYYWNVMWIDAMALLPLVILGIYYIVHKRKFMLYTVALAVTLVANYYMGFMVCIFSVLFFFVLFFSGSEPDADPLQPADAPKKGEAKRFFGAGFQFAYASLLAGALAAFALLPVAFALVSSSATSGKFPDTLFTYFNLFDFIANHFADVKPTIRSSGDVVLPNVYSGVAALILVPLFLFVPSIKSREKVSHALLLIFMFFSFNTNILNILWHANHTPNDLPYRFSFLYSFLLLWMAYKVFLHIREVPVKAIAGIGGMVALFVVLAEKIGSKNLQDAATDPKGSTVYITLAFLAAYLLIFIAMRKSTKAKAASLSMILLCCVITEVCAADVKNFEITQIKENYTTDLTDFQAVKDELYESDNSFYRMELTDLRTRMDPAWYDYRGISTFSSMAYERTANLQSRLGLGSNFINSYSYHPNTPVYNAMHNLKYLVENMSSDPDGSFIGPQGSSYVPVLDQSPMYTRRDEFTRARFTLYENNYTLPIGFFVDDGVQTWDTTSGTDPFRVQEDFWALSGAGAGVFNPIDLQLTDGYTGGTDATISGTYVSYNNKTSGVPAFITCVIKVDKPQNVYIETDSSHVTIKVNLPNGETVNRDHDTQAIFDLGWVTPEEPMSIDLCLDKDAPANGSFSAYVYGLNMDVFTAGYAKLKSGGLNITSYSDTMLTGTITAPDDGLLYTSIPYDKGWQIFIDGKALAAKDYVKLGDDALLGANITQGTHTVTLRYVPQGLYAGLIISCLALILLALTGLISELLRRRKQVQPAAKEPTDLFSTANLRPEDFSLDTPWEEAPPVGFIPPAGQPDDAAEPFSEPLPPAYPEHTDDFEAAEEFAAQVNAQAGQPDDTAARGDSAGPSDAPEAPASINSMLLEMQARAEELRRKMQVESKPDDDDDGQSFRLT